jgi:hypothetical protein
MSRRLLAPVPVLFAVVGVLTLAAPMAHAYRPPTSLLLNRAMDRQIQRETKSLRIEAETQAYDISGMPQGAPLSEKWWVLPPSTMRRDVETATGTQTEIRLDDKLITRTNSGADKNSKAAIDPFFLAITTAPPLDDSRGAERLSKALKAYGGNPEMVSLARFDGRVAWLIGSKPWEADKPQLWLDKDALVVLRVVKFQKKADGRQQKIDERYLGWGSPIGGMWFPSSIEVWIDDRLVQRTLVRNVERNTSFDAGLFK